MSRFALILTTALLAGTGAAQADGPLQRRLLIETELVRDASFTGVDSGQAHLAQRLSLQLVLSSDGTPMVGNPLDPDDSRRQLERARRTQQRVQSALQKAGAGAAPDPQAIAALQAQAQALLARCGQDRACLMREASAMSAAQAGAVPPAAQGRPQGFGTAGAGGHDGEADETVETPYLMFTGAAACQWDAALSIDERIEGSFADVQGTVPFTATTRAEGRDRDALLCPLVQAVLDTRSGRLWTHVLPAVRGVPGRSVRAEKGRAPRQSDALQAPRWHESQDWLAARLARLDAAGSDRFERSLPGGRIRLQLRWKFAPL